MSALCWAAVTASAIALGLVETARATMSDCFSLQPNARSTTAVAANAAGSVIVGEFIDAGGTTHALRWSRTSGLLDLGTLGGGSSSALGVSMDGSVVVGTSGNWWPGGVYHAFRWTRATGMVDLSARRYDFSSTALGVSANGSVVVGFAKLADADVQHAFRWTAADSMRDLNGLNDLDTLLHQCRK